MQATAKKASSSDQSIKKRTAPPHALSEPTILSIVSQASDTFIQQKATCACGGGCPRCQGNHQLQAKLKISAPNDKYEQEADQVADQVMRTSGHAIQRKPGRPFANDPWCGDQDEMLQTKPLAAQITPFIQRQPLEEEEEEELLQPKALASSLSTVQRQPLEEEEETLQTKSESVQQNIVEHRDEARIKNFKGSGQPLSEDTRTFFETRMGHDFGDIRIHHDSRSAEAAQSVKARAFTMGNNIVFNAGQYASESQEGRRLLAHELTHTIQQSASNTRAERPTNTVSQVAHKMGAAIIARQGLLNNAQEQAAIAYTNRHYDERSRRIIQYIAGTNSDGVFRTLSAEAVAAFQSANGLTIDGMVGPQTLGVMVPNRAVANFHDHAIQLVVDYYNLDVTSDTLSIIFDPAVGLTALGSTTFESGNLRVISIGPLAFLTLDLLRFAIQNELNTPAPAVAPVGPRPTRLNHAEEQAAIEFNRRRFHDRRSILGIQSLVGTGLDGIIGRDTVERVAEFQHNNALVVDGKVGEATLRVMVAQLDAANQQNTAIRMIMDFYNMSEYHALLNISYDSSLLIANASTGGIIPGPSRVRIGPPAFARGFAALVHTIAHELEHVRQRRAGIMSQPVREFLGEALEIMSIGMPEEDIAGVMDDARRALRMYRDNMTPAERTTHRARFIQVRNRVRQRFNAASVADQAIHRPTLDAYNAVVVPPP